VTIQQILEVALLSGTFKIFETSILLKQRKIISTIISDTKKIIMYHSTSVITLSQKIKKTPTPNLSYAQVAQNKNTITPKNQTHLDTTIQLTAKLTSFINELKSIITPLISLLTKLINQVLDKK
jgi:hypothetical protein